MSRVERVSRTAEIAASDPNRVIIFDTTLRDGEQAPGFSMSAEAKLKMAHVLRDLGVDVIEAGFAAASPGDEECIRRVCGEIEGPVFASLSRANEKDIDASFRALAPAPKSHRRSHIFLATSPIHRSAKLRMSTNEVLATISRTVEYAATMFDDVEFSAEDAFRTEPEFLAEALMAAADAGAQTLNVPDTVGYATPEEVRARFAYLDGIIRPRHADVIFSSHAHNDLGLAVANSLAAVEGGARQIEGAINGIGERAGNASIEEIIMALRTRADRYGVTVASESRHLVRASETLREVTETVIARNKAIVGLNAFAHEAGIHQHGMMADARTYEIMRPEDVGFEGSYFVLGKHSGRHAVGKRAEALGHVLEGQRLADVFAGFKQRADQIGEINDAELTAIIAAVTAAGASAQMDKTYATAG
ncbi:2-isopropylmalate synthase [Brevundimonas sp. P7753]|uniref:2-isopropylmalate synthase n=1 Tax=Brevundimonas sp. P7753 TaxID=2726982 RepID=UPI0015BC3192|nr:2-isopropylmalate synthase [Brevundimonas sp. P7753]NWE52940.1 2-isopropylmalate synthase [Brevundimonas sp. P7753]